MVRYLLLGILVTCALVGIRLWWAQDTDNNPATNQNTTLNAAKTPASTSQAKVAQPASSDPVNAWLAVGNTAEAATQGSLPAGAAGPTAAWTSGDFTLAPPGQYQRKGISAQPLRLNREAIANLQAGDEIVIPIPQSGQSYTVGIDSIGHHLNGDRSLTGTIKNETLSYNVVLTEGRHSTFATLNTPDGAFMLEAIGDNGWITSLADLDFLSDPDQTDALIPGARP
jgi:hypothetical protein